MQLKHLRSFVAVAEALHFRRAAALVGVTQPALSQHIAQLERDVGALLLTRDQRHVELTPAGEAMLQGARDIIARVDETMRSVRALGASRTRTLVVGQIGYVSHAYLPAAVSALRHHFPDAMVETVEMGPEEALRGVREGHVDVGFAFASSLRHEGPRGRLPVGFGVHAVDVADLVVREVKSGHWSVVVPTGHPFAALEAVPLGRMADQDWILFHRSVNPQAYGFLMSRCAEAGFVPRVAHHVLQPQHGPPMVAGGVGCFVVGDYVLGELPAGVVARPLTGFDAEITIVAAWRPASRTPLLKAFLEGLPALNR